MSTNKSYRHFLQSMVFTKAIINWRSWLINCQRFTKQHWVLARACQQTISEMSWWSNNWEETRSWRKFWLSRMNIKKIRTKNLINFGLVLTILSLVRTTKMRWHCFCSWLKGKLPHCNPILLQEGTIGQAFVWRETTWKTGWPSVHMASLTIATHKPSNSSSAPCNKTSSNKTGILTSLRTTSWRTIRRMSLTNLKRI